MANTDAVAGARGSLQKKNCTGGSWQWDLTDLPSRYGLPRRLSLDPERVGCFWLEASPSAGCFARGAWLSCSLDRARLALAARDLGGRLIGHGGEQEYQADKATLQDCTRPAHASRRDSFLSPRIVPRSVVNTARQGWSLAHECLSTAVGEHTAPAKTLERFA